MKVVENPLISVVIPVYNRSHIIQRTIDSVLNQTYQNIEIIIVDDCSNDSEGLIEIIDNYSNVIYTRHSVNRHGSAARNTGMKLATGDYIALLDSDDAWETNKIEVYLSTLLNHDVDFLFSQVMKYGSKNRLVPIFGLNPGESYSDYLLYRNGSIQTSTLFFHRDIFNDIKFDENLVRFQDYDFILEMEKNNKTSFFIEQPLTIMYDDDQENRISNSTNIEPAINWLNKIQCHISKKAYYTFYVTRIVDFLVKNGERNKGVCTLINPKCFYFSNKKFWIKTFIKCLLARSNN
ncbi:hypothetical protein BCS94_09930 [Vibrio breoganii]|uniref:glycosyltransferase family 2 protein n=1 Tax=Vibrio breoganii TaxID=553239 RepID=UPI000C862822|nr:glycosyltransferase [Vibrio breoganii]PMP07275.1 hypothetical protein BCS94_09930 [Vibrio breoganii]